MGASSSKNDLKLSDVDLSKYSKSTIKQYYLTHGNGETILVAVCKSPKVLKLYRNILINSKNVKKDLIDKVNSFVPPGTVKKSEDHLMVGDYRTSQGLGVNIFESTPFQEIKYKHFMTGADVNPDNTYLPTRFGMGNSILVVTDDNKVLIVSGYGVDENKLVKPDDIIGYVSPIENNDVPMPLILTKNSVHYNNKVLELKSLPLVNIDQLLSHKHPGDVNTMNAKFIKAVMSN